MQWKPATANCPTAVHIHIHIHFHFHLHSRPAAHAHLEKKQLKQIKLFVVFRKGLLFSMVIGIFKKSLLNKNDLRLVGSIRFS